MELHRIARNIDSPGPVGPAGKGMDQLVISIVNIQEILVVFQIGIIMEYNCHTLDTFCPVDQHVIQVVGIVPVALIIHITDLQQPGIRHFLHGVADSDSAGGQVAAAVSGLGSDDRIALGYGSHKSVLIHRCITAVGPDIVLVGGAFNVAAGIQLQRFSAVQRYFRYIQFDTGHGLNHCEPEICCQTVDGSRNIRCTGRNCTKQALSVKTGYFRIGGSIGDFGCGCIRPHQGDRVDLPGVSGKQGHILQLPEDFGGFHRLFGNGIEGIPFGCGPFFRKGAGNTVNLQSSVRIKIADGSQVPCSVEPFQASWFKDTSEYAVPEFCQISG